MEKNLNNLSRRDFLKAAWNAAQVTAATRIAAPFVGINSAFSTLESFAKQEFQPPIVNGLFLTSTDDGTVLGNVDQSTYENSIYHDDLEFIRGIYNTKLQQEGYIVPKTDIYIPAKLRGGDRPVATLTPTEDNSKRISALFTVDGLDRQGNVVSKGYYFAPNKSGVGYNVYTSETADLEAALYPEGFGQDFVIQVPDPKTGNLLAFQYQTSDTPSRLVGVGTPNTENKIVWMPVEAEKSQEIEENGYHGYLIDVGETTVKLMTNIDRNWLDISGVDADKLLPEMLQTWMINLDVAKSGGYLDKPIEIWVHNAPLTNLERINTLLLPNGGIGIQWYDSQNSGDKVVYNMFYSTALFTMKEQNEIENNRPEFSAISSTRSFEAAIFANFELQRQQRAGYGINGSPLDPVIERFEKNTPEGHSQSIQTTYTPHNPVLLQQYIDNNYNTTY